MSNVMRSLIVKVGADLTNFDKSMKTMSKNMARTSKQIGSMGSGLTKSLTLPIVGAVAGLSTLVMKSAATADELQRLSDVTGLSAERLQELKYAGSNLGVELETITGAQAKLTKAMFAAKGGTGKQADAFKQLGISVTDSNGNLKDSKEIMVEAFNALNKMGNATERDATSMQLFGKSAMELNPLIKAGGDELARLTDEAKKNGAVISNENIAKLDRFGDSIDAMKLSIQGAAGKIAADLVPTLEELLPIIQNQIIPAVGNFVKKVADLIVKFSKLDKPTQHLIEGFVIFAVVIGPVLSGFATILSIGSALAGILGGIGVSAGLTGAAGGFAALGATLGPIMLVVGAIALIVAGIKAVNDGLAETQALGRKTSGNQKKAGVAGVKDSFYYENMKTGEAKVGNAAAIQAGARYSQQLNIGGTITVKGVTDSGQLVATSKLLSSQIAADLIRQQRRNK